VKGVVSRTEREDRSPFVSGMSELKKSHLHTDENGEETVEDWACAEDCPIRIMDEQSGISKGRVGMTQQSSTNKIYGKFESKGNTKINDGISDLGGSSRFFYVAKASKSERNRGLPEGMTNNHPTVKSVSIMRYLVRLITPPNGIVLDPFCGSGTTGIACKLEGFQFVGMEQDAEYCKIAEARITNYVEEKEPISVISEINNEKSEKDEKPKNQLVQMQLF
jgi:site-specific DNA-methyltransferase (adenine-specific)